MNVQALSIPAVANSLWAAHFALTDRLRRAQVLPNFRKLRAASEEPHAAIDVVADAARRNHSVGRARGHDTSDGKSISLVDIGHCEGGFLHTWERRGVDQLVQGALLDEMPDHRLAGIEPCSDAHIIAEAARDLPCAGRNVLEVGKAYWAHGFFSTCRTQWSLPARRRTRGLRVRDA
jgi:hypothetical protein